MALDYYLNIEGFRDKKTLYDLASHLKKQTPTTNQDSRNNVLVYPGVTCSLFIDDDEYTDSNEASVLTISFRVDKFEKQNIGYKNLIILTDAILKYTDKDLILCDEDESLVFLERKSGLVKTRHMDHDIWSQYKLNV